MSYNRKTKGIKPSASPEFINQSRNNKKKGLARFLRRYALYLGALLVLVAIGLVVVLQPAKAGSYTVTPSAAVLVSGQSLTGTPATDMDTDNNTSYTAIREKANTRALDVDITLDPVTAQANKIYKATLSVDAQVTLGFDNVPYYAKMYTGATTSQDFATAALGTFSATDGSNDTVTLTETNILNAQAFYNGAIANGNQAKVKIQNARTYNGTTDNTQSELSIDYLAVTFYEDTNVPTTGALSPANNQTIQGTVAVTLNNVQDNASANESGIKEVQFYYDPPGATSWTLIGTDTTPDGSNNYSVNWDTNLPATPDGSYGLKAVALDKVDNQSLDALSTNIQVLNSDVTPPSNVSITSPPNGSSVNSPTITAAAQDNVGVTKMEFYSSANPATPFATDLSSAGGWTATWNTSGGGYIDGNSYDVWVKAFDAANNSTASSLPHRSYTVDRVNPTVQSTVPANASIDVPSGRAPITATFSEDMDWTTVNNTTFTLTSPVSGSISGQVTTDGPSKTASFTPDANLPGGQTITARLTTAVKDKAGNNLAADKVWTFQTVDTASPIVTAITPGNDTSLKLESREITALTTDNVAVTKVEFWWRDPDFPSSWTKFGEDTSSGDGWKAVLNTSAMSKDGNYDIKAIAFDAAGNPPGELSVIYHVDKTLPQVSSTLPANGAVGISRAPSINVVFSEDMGSASFIENSTVYLTRYGSFEIVNTKLNYNPITRTATMVMPFGSFLNYNTTYTATVTTMVYDLAGNFLEKAKTWNFTTEIDLIPPKTTVTDVDNPYISPTNVDGTNDNVQVTFNIDQESTVHLDVLNEVGTEVYSSPEVFVPAGNGHVLAWNGRNNLGQVVPDGTYTLRIIAVDPSGNVGRAKVKPNVIVDNTSPWSRTAAAESRSKVKLTFSEPMNLVTATNPFFYTIFEKDNEAAILNISKITMVDNMSVRIETTNQQTSGREYTVRIENVEDKQGNPIQSPTTVDFMGFSPHGLYTSQSSLCSSCHSSHAGVGGRLINQTNLKGLCYNCHGTGGQSTYNTVYSDFNAYSHHPVEQFVDGGDSKISCDDCHNVHGDLKTATTVYPMLLKSEKAGQKFNEGNEFCWTCHGTGSSLRSPYGDKQTFYPADGTAHNQSSFDPASGTQVRCLKCHTSHGSTLPKMLRTEINSQAVTGNNDSQCYACHTDSFATSDSSWNGQAIYGSAGNAHQSQQCQICHDPHSTENGKFLKYTYDTDYSPTKSVGYSAANYQSCNGACHFHENQIETTLTKVYKDSPTDPAPTGFWNAVLYDVYPNDPRVNLHDFHLNMEKYRPGEGNATCKECHRPHGAISAENPALDKQVGFPATTVTNNVYATPRWVIETTETGHNGACFLNCHGKNHNGTGYSQSGPAAVGGNKDGNCYSCHGQGTLPGNLDIYSLMGASETGTGGKPYKHIVSNIEATDTSNGCMAACHEPHSTFDPRGAASNTKLMDWAGNVQSNDQNLCQNCHNSSSPVGTPKIIDKNLFTTTSHGNYQEVYHDYGTGGGFKANCLKCHTPHGSLLDNLINFESPSGQASARDDVNVANDGKNNSVCLACHTIYRAATTNWPGNALYTHASNAHGNATMSFTDSLGNTSSAKGYCLSCHDPHGVNDAGTVIPDFLRAKGTASCYACHTGTSSTIPDWPGSTSYDAPSAHKTSVSDGSHGTGYCENCHAVHGKDDGTGKPSAKLLYPKETGKANSCFNNTASCHGSGAAASNNIESIYAKTYKHGTLTSPGHLSTERNTGPGWLPANNRHAECEDCHNSHAAKATTNPTTLSDGNVKDSEAGVWGITLKDGSNNPIADPSNPALWPAAGQAPANTNIVVINNSVKEWQICAKCHSAWAYGATKPTSTKWDGTNDPAGQTDVLADFNPNNQGHHAVIAPGKNQPGAANTNFANTFVSPRWGPGARVTCSDCHGSDLAADARGTHGSNFRFLLKKNTTGSGDAAVFCLNCHRQDVYGDPATTSPANASWSRFTHPTNGAHIIASTTTSNNHASGIWCLNCHMGDTTGGSHGSNRGVGAQGNQPVGKRLMNGAAIIGRNDDGALGGTCYTQGTRTTQNALSACQKGHSQSFSYNYNY